MHEAPKLDEIMGFLYGVDGEGALQLFRSGGVLNVFYEDYDFLATVDFCLSIFLSQNLAKKSTTDESESAESITKGIWRNG